MGSPRSRPPIVLLPRIAGQRICGYDFSYLLGSKERAWGTETAPESEVSAATCA